MRWIYCGTTFLPNLVGPTQENPLPNLRNQDSSLGPQVKGVLDSTFLGPGLQCVNCVWSTMYSNYLDIFLDGHRDGIELQFSDFCLWFMHVGCCCRLARQKANRLGAGKGILLASPPRNLRQSNLYHVLCFLQCSHKLSWMRKLK